MTSHDVVARVRRLAGTRKVGHAGTLDPMATGVLVLGVNRATRLLGHLMLTEKAYDATVRLGVATTTDDAEGEVVATASAAGTRPRPHVRAAAGGVRRRHRAGADGGLGDQGRRQAGLRTGCAPARRSSCPARPVTVHELVVHRRPAAPDGVVDVDVSVRCSSGTYIRAIARDLGAALGVGGHLTALRRTAVGPFTLDRRAHARRSWRRRLRRCRRSPTRPGAASRRSTSTTTQARDVGFGRKLDLDARRAARRSRCSTRPGVPRALRAARRGRRAPWRSSSEPLWEHERPSEPSEKEQTRADLALARRGARRPRPHRRHRRQLRRRAPRPPARRVAGPARSPAERA